MQKRQYSQEFKDSLIEAASQQGVALKDVASENEVNSALLSKWIREKRAGKISKRSQLARLTETQSAPSPNIAALRVELEKVKRERNFAITMLADHLKECKS